MIVGGPLPLPYGRRAGLAGALGGQPQCWLRELVRAASTFRGQHLQGTDIAEGLETDVGSFMQALDDRQ